MTHIVVEIGTEEAFFARGQQLARRADRSESLPEQRILSFEDPQDLTKFLVLNRDRLPFSAAD